MSEARTETCATRRGARLRSLRVCKCSELHMRVARSSGSTPEKQQDCRRWHLRPCIMTAGSASWIVAALRSSLLALRCSLLAFGTERSSPRMNSSFVAQELRQRRNGGSHVHGVARGVRVRRVRLLQCELPCSGETARRAAPWTRRAARRALCRAGISKPERRKPAALQPTHCPARLTLSRPQDIHTRPVLPITLTR